MAASPMALLPSINLLVTVDLYGCLRTDNGADGTPVALATVIERHRYVAAGIQCARKGDRLLGAEEDAHLASFADFLVDLDVPRHTILFASRLIAGR
jgi:hypothetical protein